MRHRLQLPLRRDAESIGDGRSGRLRRRWSPAPISACSSRSTGSSATSRLHWERYLLRRPRRPRRARATPTARPRGGSGCSRPPTANTPRSGSSTAAPTSLPSRMRLRVLAAIAVVPRGRPIELCGPLRAQAGGAAARPELARIRRRDPTAVAFVHQSPGTSRSAGSCCSATTSGASSRTSAATRASATVTTTRRAMRRAERADPGAPPLRPRPIGELIVDLHQWMAPFDASLAARARLRRPVRVPDVGRAGRRPQRRDDLTRRCTALAAEEYPRAAGRSTRACSGDWAEVRQPGSR